MWVQDINNSILSLGIGAEIYDTVKSFEYDNLTPAANTVCIYYSMLLKHDDTCILLLKNECNVYVNRQTCCT